MLCKAEDLFPASDGSNVDELTAVESLCIVELWLTLPISRLEMSSLDHGDMSKEISSLPTNAVLVPRHFDVTSCTFYHDAQAKIRNLKDSNGDCDRQDMKTSSSCIHSMLSDFRAENE